MKKLKSQICTSIVRAYKLGWIIHGVAFLVLLVLMLINSDINIYYHHRAIYQFLDYASAIVLSSIAPEFYLFAQIIFRDLELTFFEQSTWFVFAIFGHFVWTTAQGFIAVVIISLIRKQKIISCFW